MARTGIKALRDFFGYREGDTLHDFKAEIDALTDSDYLSLREGIENGTLTY